MRVAVPKTYSVVYVDSVMYANSKINAIKSAATSYDKQAPRSFRHSIRLFFRSAFHVLNIFISTLVEHLAAIENDLNGSELMFCSIRYRSSPNCPDTERKAFHSVG
jgi:hypothetical protein